MAESPAGPRDRNPLQTLAFALEKYPRREQAAERSELVMDSARQSANRPAYLKIAVPDEWVKALRGPRGGESLLMVVEVPRDVEERSASSIILPGEA